jgi:hypothetical protein
MRSVNHFSGVVPANSTRRWFAPRFPQDWRVVWSIVPTAPLQDTAPQIETRIMTERQSADFIQYWIEVQNLSASQVSFDSRYTVLNIT